MFEGTSPFSDHVDATFLIITGISLVVLIGLVAAMILFVVKYSRKRNPRPTNIEGNVPLEILWTAVPLVLFLGMFYLGWEGYLKTVNVPEGAVPIDVTARMWSWTFQYPNGVQTDTLYVPVNTPVKLTLRSLDVNHSLYIPAFRIKKDVIPNRNNIMWFMTPRVASYDIACAEYCGLRHAYMYTKVVSLDSSGFERWYEKVSTDQSKPYMSLVIAR
ncbi:MAG: cytochrome c oxidase subunit II [Bacteroidota bacterium]